MPPALAFGDRGSRAFGVLGGATLEYDVTLRGINLQYNPLGPRTSTSSATSR